MPNPAPDWLNLVNLVNLSNLVNVPHKQARKAAHKQSLANSIRGGVLNALPPYL